MNSEPNLSHSRQPEESDSSETSPIGATLESVLAWILTRRESGQGVDPLDVIEQNPEHAGELRSFFANDQWLAGGSAIPADKASANARDVTQSEHVSLASPTDSVGSQTATTARHPLEQEAMALQGRQIDDFLLQEPIAQGGMGIVYRATQVSLQREVAIKMIGQGILADPELRQRFRTEAEAAAAISHPNILPIHTIGCWNGLDYFVMPLLLADDAQAAAPSLSHWVNRTSKVSPRRCVAVVRDLARAVAYAHGHGIIHRDLKPDNVLLDSDGIAKIVDFGLAKWQRDDASLTQDGQILGTPHYMSPEQARGSRHVTEATDTYALGAILLALLTGRPPHPGNSAAEVIQLVLTADPPRLRDVWPRDSPWPPHVDDMDAILQSAMAYRAKDRYASADAFADDLERYLDGQPPTVQSDGLIQLVSRELKRDQHETAFANWWKTLLLMGAIVFTAHAVIQWFTLTATEVPVSGRASDATVSSESVAWHLGDTLQMMLPRALMLVGIGLVVHRSREGVWKPRNTVERPVWSTWMGYLLALACVNLLWLLGYLDHSLVMLIACLMSGFGFFAMAGHVWGGSALLGLMFFLVAIAVSALPRWGPLMFGFAWLVAMTTLSQHYRRRTGNFS
ncbi:MAG: serine/threonine-protein kinase [Planctomycetota bacterium]